MSNDRWIAARPTTRLTLAWLALSLLSVVSLQTMAETTKAPVQAPPLQVGLGLMINQITEVDQKSENFTAVYTLQLHYRDPQLAYESAAGDPPFRMYTTGGFKTLVQSKGRYWPGFTLENQQGRRDVNVEELRLFADGSVMYYERATATFQAPDFDFRAFPLDKQVFYVRVLSLLPESMAAFEPIPELTGMGPELGEEEWVVFDSFVEVDSSSSHAGLPSSRVNLGFRAHRHLLYYIVRIFIPIMLILLVSWFTFRLKDYVKRVDTGVTVLLLFIAFNFTLTSDLPRLGYLTAVDAFIGGSFLITGMLILFNVQLRHLERTGKAEQAARLDRIAIYGYWPAYIIGMSAMLLML